MSTGVPRDVLEFYELVGQLKALQRDFILKQSARALVTKPTLG